MLASVDGLVVCSCVPAMLACFDMQEIPMGLAFTVELEHRIEGHLHLPAAHRQ